MNKEINYIKQTNMQFIETGKEIGHRAAFDSEELKRHVKRITKHAKGVERNHLPLLSMIS